MIKILVTLHLAGLIFWASIFPGYAAELPLTAQAYVLMDAKTGTVLLAKNAEQKRPPASTTKIMTAILALEQGELNKEVCISHRAAAVGEASIYLEPGEKITVLNLVRGALIKSGNDATVALAEYLSGSEELFVVLMNRKAKLLGAFNSNFKNPNGLPAPEHYSTAYDLALMARYGLQSRVFQSIVSTKQITIPWYGKKWGRYLQNTNKLLWKYPGANGVKTGTTKEAGSCLVASAKRGGRQLIAVVLKSRDRFGDAATLLDYGFSSTTFENIAKGTEFGAIYVPNALNYRIPIVTAHTFAHALPKGSRLERVVILNKREYGAIKKGSPVGYLLVKSQGQELARIPLIAKDEAMPREQKIRKILHPFLN